MAGGVLKQPDPDAGVQVLAVVVPGNPVTSVASSSTPAHTAVSRILAITS
jgi:hypothetical protein